MTAKKVILFMAHLETRNFDFRATGETEEKALQALKKGWKIHCQQYGGYPDPDYILTNIGEIWYEKIYMNVCYRDNELIENHRNKKE